MLRKIKNIYKALIWAVIILILSNISGDNFRDLPDIRIPHLDKAIHFSMYLILCLLLISAIYQMNKIGKKHVVLIFAMTVSVGYGGIMELLQNLSGNNRSSDIYDFLANTAGALCAIFLYPLFRKKRWLF